MNMHRESDVERLFESGLVVGGTMVWRTQHAATRWKTPVDNGLGEALVLDFHISAVLPWKYSIQLVWSGSPIKRLDVRGSHVNHCDGTRQRWVHSTHKHPLSDRFGLSQAYTPGDILATPEAAVGPGEYRAVFETFCAECRIAVECSWVEPVVAGPTMTLAEGGAE